MGFNVRVVCESLVKICEKEDFTVGSQVTTHERLREKHMLESKESHARLDFVRHFAAQAKSRVTCKTHCLELFKVCLSHSFTNTV